MESVDFLLGNVDKQGQLEEDEVVTLVLVETAHKQDLREILEEGDSQVLRDYFAGGFDLRDLTQGTKTSKDGPIVPADDARDYSDEESLADDEGDMGDQAEDDMEELMREGQVKPEEEAEEDGMSVDLFGPDVSAQPPGQHFGADNFIALLGRDTNEENGLPWDEQAEDMFGDLSPGIPRELQEEEMERTPEPEPLEEKEPKKTAKELVKDWFPQFDPNEIPRFTEIFGTKPVELNRPVTKVPRGSCSKIYV